AVEAEVGGFLKPRYIRKAQGENGIVPAHDLRIGGDLGHVGGEKASAQSYTCRVDNDVKDGPVQDLGGRIGLDVKALGEEYGTALLHLLDAPVALDRLNAHAIGDHQERSGELLRATPGACYVALDLSCAAFAFRYQANDEHERDEEQKNEKSDEEE